MGIHGHFSVVSLEEWSAHPQFPCLTINHGRNFDPSAEEERQACDVPDSVGLLPQQSPCPLLPSTGSVGSSFSLVVAKIIWWVGLLVVPPCHMSQGWQERLLIPLSWLWFRLVTACTGGGGGGPGRFRRMGCWGICFVIWVARWQLSGSVWFLELPPHLAAVFSEKFFVWQWRGCGFIRSQG